MAGTHRQTTHLVATDREAEARFALQMAEAAGKFGRRVRELRDHKGWKGRELIARMAELGDKSINTNQLSRYEGGGAWPSPRRQEIFAAALDTSVEDLVLGPLTERKRPKRNGSPLDQLSSGAAELDEHLDRQDEDLQRVLEAVSTLATTVGDLDAKLEKLRASMPPQSETG